MATTVLILASQRHSTMNYGTMPKFKKKKDVCNLFLPGCNKYLKNIYFMLFNEETLIFTIKIENHFFNFYLN